MWVISLKGLRECWEKHSGSEGPLQAWYHEANYAEWTKPQDIKDRYPSASILANDRVVFNIGGNKYRLVVHVRYDSGRVYVRFAGTHAEYDRIDAETV